MVKQMRTPLRKPKMELRHHNESSNDIVDDEEDDDNNEVEISVELSEVPTPKSDGAAVATNEDKYFVFNCTEPPKKKRIMNLTKEENASKVDGQFRNEDFNGTNKCRRTIKVYTDRPTDNNNKSATLSSSSSSSSLMLQSSEISAKNTAYKYTTTSTLANSNLDSKVCESKTEQTLPELPPIVNGKESIGQSNEFSSLDRIEKMIGKCARSVERCMNATAVASSDSNEVFGKYVASLIRDLPVEKRLRVRFEILEFTSKIIEKEMNVDL